MKIFKTLNIMNQETKKLFFENFSYSQKFGDFLLKTTFNKCNDKEELLSELENMSDADKIINGDNYDQYFFDVTKTHDFYNEYRSDFQEIIKDIFDAGGKGNFFKMGKSIRSSVEDKKLDSYMKADRDLEKFRKIINRSITITILLSYLFGKMHENISNE